MKVILTIIAALAFSAISMQAEPSAFVVGRLLREGYTLIDSGADWRMWAKTNDVVFQQGQVVGHTNGVIELQTGLNVYSADRSKWVPATPELRIQDSVVIGHGARYEVRLAQNLNSAGAVQVLLPGTAPQWLKLNLLGLALVEPGASDATNAIIAEIRDSAAQVDGNTVTYDDVFDGIKASVRYTYSVSGISQAIIIQERLPDPEAFGLSKNAQLVAITEVIEGPEPQTEDRVWSAPGQTVHDATLDFGGMSFIPGRAFRMGLPGDSLHGVAVSKSYSRVDQRRVIFENLPYKQIQNVLQNLPTAPASTNGHAGLSASRRWLARGSLPRPARYASSNPVLRASTQSTPSSDGLVMDWDLVLSSSLRDLTFNSRAVNGDSYLIQGDVRLAGNTTVMPGALVRYASGSIYIDGQLVCPDAQDASVTKALLTSLNDDDPAPLFANHPPLSQIEYGPALVVNPTDLASAARHISVRYACPGIIPDRPTRLPTVSVSTVAAHADNASGKPGQFRIARYGGDWTLPLKVRFALSGGAQPGTDFDDFGREVTIPANHGSVTISILPRAKAKTSEMSLTLEPDSTASYIPDSPQAAKITLNGMQPLVLTPAPLPPNCIAWWKGENDATDSIGINQGTWIGSPSYSPYGEVNSCFSFDGTARWVSMANESLSLSSAFTVELWYKDSLLPSGAYGGLIAKRPVPYPGPCNFGMSMIGGSPSSILIYYMDSNHYSLGYQCMTLTVPQDQTFHHLAAVISQYSLDIVQIKGYINGVCVKTEQYPGTLATTVNNSPITIGASNPTGEWFRGLIDEASIYTRALDATEIAAIYNAGSGGKANTSPTISVQPVSQSVGVGGTATLSVTASGTLPLNYQWYKNNDYTPVGGNSSIYTLSNAQVSDAGNYYVKVSNTAGTIPSSLATLTVLTGTCATPSVTPASWWRAEQQSAADQMNARNGHWQGTASFAPGKVGDAFNFDGTAKYVYVDNPSLNFTSDFSIELWYKDGGLAPGAYGALLGKRTLIVGDPCNFGMTIRMDGTTPTLLVYYLDPAFSSFGSFQCLTYPNLPTSQTPHHLAATFHQLSVTPGAETILITLYVDGLKASTATLPGSIPRTANNAQITVGTSNTTGEWFKGLIDEVTLYSGLLSDGDVGNIFAAQSAGKCVAATVAPMITSQPQSQTVIGGADASFVVTASGSPPLSYQWFHGGAIIPGATGVMLSLSGVHLADAGEYKVVISNPAGSVASSSAVLTVLEVAAPVFSPAGGPYPSARNVTVTCSTPGAVIHYNLGGTVPTQSDPVVSSGSTVLVDHGLTLAANAWKSGFVTSQPEIEYYHIGAGVNSTIITMMPPTGSSFLACDDIPVIVEASNPAGLIAKIQLFRDGVKIAETAQSPLEYTMKSAWSGTYTFTTKVTDSYGFVASSAAVVTVTAPGPTVSLRGSQPFFTSSPGMLKASVVGVDPGNLRSLSLNGTAQPIALGAFTLSPSLSEGNNAFTLVAIDNQSRSGQATASLTLDSVTPVVSISAPSNNSSFGTTRIDVSGTFVEPSISSINVNGVPAFVSGTTWTALNVPLGTGANSIAATATDLAGNAGSATIIINGTATPTDAVQLSAAPVAGFAPLQVTFQVQANVPGTIQQVNWDFDGDGVTDQSFTTVQNVVHTYPAAGQFFPVVTVVTSSGRFSSNGGWNGDQQLRINVQAGPTIVRSISVTDPVDVKCTPDGNIYVLSRSTATITEFNSSGSLLRSLSGIGPNPNGLAVDSAGNVFVAISGDNQVRKFNPTPGSPGSFTPDGLFNGGRIGRTDKAPGSGDAELNAPFGVALSSDCLEIAISDWGNHRIQRFKSEYGTWVDCTFVGSFGEQGNGPGQLNSPKGLAYDSMGYVYIVDSGNTRMVLCLSSDYEGTSGASGQAIGQFQAPVNIATGPRGIYVSDTGNNRIEFFEPIQSGGVLPVPFTPRGVLAAELGLNQPKAVAVLPDYVQEKLCIADTGNNRVLVVTLPCDAPDVVWSSMRQQLVAGNITGAISHFAKNAAEKYRANFLIIGSTSIASMASQMPSSLSPIYIENATAQYRFEQTLGGQVLSFPVDFVRENGTWKIAQF